jgi:hypothetical protein
MFQELDNSIISLYRQGKYQESYDKCLSLASYTDSKTMQTRIAEHFDRLCYNISNVMGKLQKRPRAALFVTGEGIKWQPGSTNLQWNFQIVMAIANILTKDYAVDVYAIPEPKSIYSLPCANPRYLNITECSGKYDLAILWSRLDCEGFKGFCCGKIFCIIHEVPRIFGSLHESSLIGEPCLNGCLYLSEQHRQTAIQKHTLLEKVPYITGFFLPLTPPNFTDFPEKKRGKNCVYCGPFNKEFELLLILWTNVIIKVVPTAKLTLLYFGYNKPNITVKQAISGISSIGVDYFNENSYHRIFSSKSIIIATTHLFDPLRGSNSVGPHSGAQTDDILGTLPFLSIAQYYGCLPVMFDTLKEYCIPGYEVKFNHEDCFSSLLSLGSHCIDLLNDSTTSNSERRLCVSNFMADKIKKDRQKCVEFFSGRKNDGSK